MRHLLLSALAAAAGFAGGVQAQESRPIPDLITSQIEAFRARDFDTAFGFASDSLRRMFGSPENFARMVTQGYPMVLDPADVRFLGLSDRAGAQVQRVLIRDEAGRSYLLEYTVITDDETLRISAVRLLPEAGTGV